MPFSMSRKKQNEKLRKGGKGAKKKVKLNQLNEGRN